MYHLPVLSLMFEDICRLCKGDTHPASGKGVYRFHAGHPSKLVIDMDRDFARVDVHSMCVLEDIYPTRANLLPACDCFPIWVNTLYPIRL